MAKASSMARSDADRTIAQWLLEHNSGEMEGEAEAFARRAITELNQEEHVLRERDWRQAKVDPYSARDPKYQPMPFYPDEARERFRGIEASSWSLLARIYIQQGRNPEARQALQKSLAAARTAEAASAFADLAFKEGDLHSAIDALGTAILTGKAGRAAIERFQASYRDAVGPRFPDPETWLDRRYRAEFRNPIPVQPFTGAAANRAVLLELFTGAGCEPCTSVDLATDALLQRYARDQLVVMAHHMHAPLVTPAAEQRARYYGVGGAPMVVMDGVPIEPGEGLASVTQPVFNALDTEVMKRIIAPAEARIRLRAAWAGPALEVQADIDGVKDPGPKLRLRIFLVETEVSYSGESGVRLHPMVVRSQANAERNGFAIAGSSLHAAWTFAADARNQASRGKPAVVALVQDEATRRILQSAFLPVEAPGK
jgi:hypothetical protein